MLRTKKYYQLAGLAGHYLGKPGKYFMLAVESFAMYSANIAYLIASGSALRQLFGGYPQVWATIVFAVVATIVYMDLRKLGKVEFLILAAKLLLVGIIIAMLLPGVKFEKLAEFNASQLFAPFGVTMFALMCYSVIPEVEEVLARRKQGMLKVIVSSFIIGFMVYLLFTMGFVGALPEVKEIATESLNTPLAPLLALTAILTPYISLSMVLKDVYRLDLKIDHKIAWMLSMFPPYVFYMILSPDFINLLSFSGSIASGLMGLTVGYMVYVARRKGDETPAYVVPGGLPLLIATMGIFLFGMLFYFLG